MSQPSSLFRHSLGAIAAFALIASTAFGATRPPKPNVPKPEGNSGMQCQRRCTDRMNDCVSRSMPKDRTQKPDMTALRSCQDEMQHCMADCNKK